ncbi:GIY-YIG nuclease family protein [Dechloromonas sp. ZY10]|uniref:GIY-YIG nuclease family protein n=1 Tax=Dechloromonas aquae TaxID=2664436 RepID=UPI003527C612
MPVYFIAENENDDHSSLRVKIGRTKDLQVRLRALRTGSPYDLKLMGWIESDDDKQLELALHERYTDQRIHLEWFYLQPEDVLAELKSHGIYSYISIEKNTFEIMSRDKDGVPEYYGAWKWADVDDSEFCPKCGCSCGLQYNENYGSERCLKCGIIYEYAEEPREEP